MELREIGAGGIKAFVVGLGALRLSGFMWGGTDAETAVTAIQDSYSTLHRAIEREPLLICMRHDISVLAYTHLASGLLSSTM